MSSVHKYNALNYDDALLRLVDLATNDNVSAAAIAGGGTGYVVGDILTVTGGTVVSALVATLEVTSVAGGVINGIRVFDCGSYSAQPVNPVSVTGGTGTGATFNLTFEINNWILNRNVASSTSAINFPLLQAGSGGNQVLEREILLEGVGNAGTDQIFVGFLEVRDTAGGSYSWHLSGMTGFSTLDVYEAQPGFSYLDPLEIASFVPLSNGSIECWFYISPRELHGVMRMGTTYNNFYTGFLNPFATPTEFPYPLYISGCSSKWNELFSITGVRQSGLVDPGAYTSTGGSSRGPGGVRFVDGVWYPVVNWTFTGSTRNGSIAQAIYPCQQMTTGGGPVPPDDQLLANVPALNWEAFIPDSGVPGTATELLFPSDDAGGDQTQLVPTMVFFTATALQVLGELNQCYWGSTTGNSIVTEDRVIIGGEYYRAFQNCNRSDAFSFVFLKEDA